MSDAVPPLGQPAARLMPQRLAARAAQTAQSGGLRKPRPEREHLAPKEHGLHG